MYLIYLLLFIALIILWFMVVPNYKQIIKKAWQITWRNKILWVFGFFAVLVGSSGEIDVVFNKLSAINNIPENVFTFQSLFQTGVIVEILKNIKDFFVASPFQAILLILILLVITVIFIWLVIVAQIGLIQGILKADNNEKVRFKEGLRQGKIFFWPIFWLNFISKIIIYGLLLFISLPLIVLLLLKSSLIATVIFTFFAFIILVPLSIAISFITRYAIIFIIYKDLKIVDSIKASLKLFKKYWLISIEMAFLILGIGLFSALALIIALVLLVSPFFLLGIFGVLIKAQVILSAAIILGLIVIALSILIYGAIFATFQYANWTLLFLDFVGEEKIGSKIVRIITRIFPFLDRKKD